MGKPRNKKLISLTISTRKRLLTIIPILLFAGVGAYVVFQSKAATTARVYFDSSQASVGHPVGSTYDLKVFVDMPTPPSGSAMYMRVFALIDPSSAQYLGLDCGVAGPCDNHLAGEGQDGSDLCIKVEDSKFGVQGVKVLTMHNKSVNSNPPSLRLSADWWANNVCGSTGGNLFIASDQGSNIYAKCGEHPDWFECAAGPNDTPATQQNNTNSNSKAKNPGNNGGGSGGSSATTQSQQPNTVPSSSGQGDQNQAGIEPSPFFDGKQYEPGSDPDILGVNTTFSVAGHNLKFGWLFVLLVLIFGSVAYFIWKKPKFLARLGLPGLKLK